jgi:hypothetical protein
MGEVGVEDDAPVGVEAGVAADAALGTCGHTPLAPFAHAVLRAHATISVVFFTQLTFLLSLQNV